MMRIFILSTHSLFGAGLEMVLRRQAGVSIVGQESDLERAIGAINTLHPDLTLVVSHNQVDDPALAIARLMEGTQTKIAAINLESNAVRLYAGNQREARQVDYLAQALQAEMAPPTPTVSGGTL